MSTPAMYERKLAEIAALEARLAEAERLLRWVSKVPTSPMLAAIQRAAMKWLTDSADVVICEHCGLGEQFDGTWHKPDCPTLNHPEQKLMPPMTGSGDGNGNAPKDSR